MIRAPLLNLFLKSLMPDPEFLEISEEVHLPLQNLLPLEFLSVLLDLKCYPEESTGIKNKIESGISLFVPPVGSKKFVAKHSYCPWFHPQFVKGSGCYRYIRIDIDETIREQIDYGSESSKRDFNRRSSSERIFSRLLSILMQEPTVKGLRSTANLCTIAHITVLAVAYFASFVKEPKRIRFVKSFLPNL